MTSSLQPSLLASSGSSRSVLLPALGLFGPAQHSVDQAKCRGRSAWIMSYNLLEPYDFPTWKVSSAQTNGANDKQTGLVDHYVFAMVVSLVARKAASHQDADGPTPSRMAFGIVVPSVENKVNERLKEKRVGWRPSLMGWRPSLVGWRPSLVGWSQSLVGWRPPLLGWRPSLVGWRPSLLGFGLKEKRSQNPERVKGSAHAHSRTRGVGRRSTCTFFW